VKHAGLIRLVATVVVIVFALGIWATGGKPDLGWLRFYSAAVLIATALLWLWETLLWKIRPAQHFRAVPRDVSGTWKGTLESLWKASETGTSPARMAAYLVVRQTASTVSVVLLTNESRSASSLGSVSTGLDTPTLDYMYLNRPDPRFENQSRMHHGSTQLDITGQPATRLRGRYWTDRNSRGELDFVERTKHKADDFEQAASLFKPSTANSRPARRSQPRLRDL